MPKPTRSPVLGYNHNLKYRGRIFHVQTEDSGPVESADFHAPVLRRHDPRFQEARVRPRRGRGRGARPDAEPAQVHPEGAQERAARRPDHRSFSPRVGSSWTARWWARWTRWISTRRRRPGARHRSPLSPHSRTPSTTSPPRRIRRRWRRWSRWTCSSTRRCPCRWPGRPPWEHIPMSAHAPAPQAPLSETPTDRTGVAATGAARRRPVHSTPAMGAPVVVQRTVSVGGTASVTGGSASVAGSTSTFAGRQLLRGRKPAPSIPYVVKEGTHPLAETPTPAPVDVSPPAAPAPLAAASMPPARPLTPPPVNADERADHQRAVGAHAAGGGGRCGGGGGAGREEPGRGDPRVPRPGRRGRALSVHHRPFRPSAITSPPTTPVASPLPAAPTATPAPTSTSVDDVVVVDGDGAVAGDAAVLGVVGGDVIVGLGRSAGLTPRARRFRPACPSARRPCPSARPGSHPRA